MAIDVSTLASLYTNPDFTATTRDIINPSLRSGSDLAKRLGIVYDLDKLKQIFEDATQAGIDAERQDYDTAVKQFYKSLATQGSNMMDTLRKANANAINTGAARGIAAANQLSALLGLAQQGSEDAYNLAMKGINMGANHNAQLAAARQNALEQYNDIGARLGSLANEEYAAQVQQYVAELEHQLADAQAKQQALLAAMQLQQPSSYTRTPYTPSFTETTGATPSTRTAGATPSTRTAGATASTRTANTTETNKTTADSKETQQSFGRYTDAFLKAFPEEADFAYALGQLYDTYDRTGKIDEESKAMLATAYNNNPVVASAKLKKYYKVAQDVINSTELIDPKTGEYKEVPNVASLLAKTHYVLSDKNKPNVISTELLPTKYALTGVSAIDDQIKKDAFKEMYDYAASKKLYNLQSYDNVSRKANVNTYKYGDKIYSSDINTFINPEWSAEKQQFYKQLLEDSGILDSIADNKRVSEIVKTEPTTNWGPYPGYATTHTVSNADNDIGLTPYGTLTKIDSNPDEPQYNSMQKPFDTSNEQAVTQLQRIVKYAEDTNQDPKDVYNSFLKVKNGYNAFGNIKIAITDPDTILYRGLDDNKLNTTQFVKRLIAEEAKSYPIITSDSAKLKSYYVNNPSLFLTYGNDLIKQLLTNNSQEAAAKERAAKEAAKKYSSSKSSSSSVPDSVSEVKNAAIKSNNSSSSSKSSSKTASTIDIAALQDLYQNAFDKKYQALLEQSNKKPTNPLKQNPVQQAADNFKNVLMKTLTHKLKKSTKPKTQLEQIVEQTKKVTDPNTYDLSKLNDIFKDIDKRTKQNIYNNQSNIAQNMIRNNAYKLW